MAVDINWGALETVNPMARLAEGERYAEKKRDDALRQQQAQSRQQALQQYSTGDASGAKRTALSGGDLETYTALSQLDGEQRKAARERAEQLATLAYGVKRTPYEQRKAVLGSMAPQLTELGFQPDQIGSFDPTDEALDAVISQGLTLKDMIDRDAKENEPYTLGRGDIRFRGEKEVARGLPPEEQFLIVPEGGKAIPKSAMGGGGYGAPAPAAPSAPSFGGGGSGVPRNQRNNNPGNIEDGEFAKSLPGYRGSDGRFAIFDTPDAGRAAQGRLLASYGERGYDTPAKIINRWAPPSDNNPTDAYVQFVAQKLGVDPDTRLDLQNPQVQQAVAAAIEQFEGGGQSASNDGALMGQAGQDSIAPDRSGDPPGTVYGNPKPRPRQMTAEEKASWGLPADGVYVIDATGKPSAVRQPAADKPPTEGQVNAASLAYAAFGGNDRMNDLAKRGIFKPVSPTESLFKFDREGVARVIARTDQDRQFVQAAKEFLAPILRRDTGAAVTDTELVYYMDTYIPRFEDSPQVLWQKAKARDTALRRIYGAGRKAFDQEYGAPGKWQVLTDPRAKPAPKKGDGAKAPVRVKTPEEAMRLAPGTVFITPDGRKKVR